MKHILLLVFGFLPVTANLAARQSTVSQSLEGTTWIVTTSLNRSFTVDFRKDNRLEYASSNGVMGNGSWSLNGKSVSFVLNGQPVKFQGTIDSDKMQGDADGEKDQTWKWLAVKEQALVVTPVVPIYSPLAATVRQGGDVLADLQIDQNGSVVSAVFSTDRPLLRRTVEDAARKWRFNQGENAAYARSVRLVFTFEIVPVDCKKVSPPPAAPVYVSPYHIEVRRNDACVEPEQAETSIGK